MANEKYQIEKVVPSMITNQLNLAQSNLDILISCTPTSDRRNLLTKANILMMEASLKLRNARELP